MSSGILDVDNVERARMSFSGGDHSDATQIVATSDHDQVARVELDVVLDLTVLEVETDRVVDFDVWVWVSDGAAVVSDDHWDALWRNQDFLHFAEFVLLKIKQLISSSNNRFLNCYK